MSKAEEDERVIAVTDDVAPGSPNRELAQPPPKLSDEDEEEPGGLAVPTGD